ncbi:hypothetical protein [Methylobacterium sp. OT2]|uniref:hypothetical protein n=1 Tax=Methylobacterium sp. OT2 TaxID=2813779 RepID=UPI00197C00B0|nr:hypothetical protein [Methylobacterium sp. OT2]MBN4095606.1 hypothetical protein [Methylobacterium sp. OT2]
MNAPHPIRALHGHLVSVAPSLDAIAPAEPISAHERGLADGQLLAGMSGLDSLLEGLSMGAWYVDRATQAGAGRPYDLEKLERIAGRLAEIRLQIETATTRLTDKLAGAR